MNATPPQKMLLLLRGLSGVIPIGKVQSKLFYAHMFFVKHISGHKIICCLSCYLIAFFLLSSCATLQDSSEAKDVHIIENVPFFPQEDYQCGPSSLAMVLNFWGLSVTPGEIAKEVFSESARGTLNIDMVLFAQKAGMSARQERGGICELKRYIDDGYPVIVLVDYGFSLYQRNHFMVINGYNEHGLIANSGRERNKFIPDKDFQRIWEKTNFWLLLIKPK